MGTKHSHQEIPLFVVEIPHIRSQYVIENWIEKKWSI